MKTMRIIIASAIGALVSVILTVFGTSAVLSRIIIAVISLPMCAISFGITSIHRLARQSMILWCGGFVLGGVMTALISIGNTDSYSSSRNIMIPNIYLAISAAVSVCLFIYLGRTRTKKRVDISFTLSNKEYKADALVDSGNLLCDPFSGEPVIILGEQLVPELLKDAANKAMAGESSSELKIHTLPASGIGGESLLFAIRPDSLIVNHKNCRALVACTVNGENKIKETIVPESLIQ